MPIPKKQRTAINNARQRLGKPEGIFYSRLKRLLKGKELMRMYARQSALLDTRATQGVELIKKLAEDLDAGKIPVEEYSKKRGQLTIKYIQGRTQMKAMGRLILNNIMRVSKIENPQEIRMLNEMIFKAKFPLPADFVKAVGNGIVSAESIKKARLDLELIAQQNSKMLRKIRIYKKQDFMVHHHFTHIGLVIQGYSQIMAHYLKDFQSA
ncbi:MAG: hypothetical protein Q7R70_06475 [Candidatus Diapherotrites archaeon]|nr:hypothetical protein [Candidatus Diapherotrites archaeon]